MYSIEYRVWVFSWFFFCAILLKFNSAFCKIFIKEFKNYGRKYSENY